MLKLRTPVVSFGFRAIWPKPLRTNRSKSLLPLPIPLSNHCVDLVSLLSVWEILQIRTRPIFNCLVRVIDDFAVQKLRQIEAKYPVINTPTKDVRINLSLIISPICYNVSSTLGCEYVQRKNRTCSQCDEFCQGVYNIDNSTWQRDGKALSIFW